MQPPLGPSFPPLPTAFDSAEILPSGAQSPHGGEAPTRGRAVLDKQYRDKCTRVGWSGLPRSVHACEAGAWSWVLPPGEDGSRRVVPWRCGSWRHPGACRAIRAAADGERVLLGLEGHGRDEIAFGVLTFDPGRTGTAQDAYRGLLGAWKRFRQRLMRRYGSPEYVVVVEETSRDWPHLNILWTGAVGREAVQIASESKVVGNLIHPVNVWPEYQAEAVCAGFGRIVYVEPVRGPTEAVARYVGKLCGEAVKMSQVPVNAPPKFHRVRASKGRFPQVDPETGGAVLVFESVENLSRLERLGEMLRRAVREDRDGIAGYRLAGVGESGVG